MKHLRHIMLYYFEKDNSANCEICTVYENGAYYIIILYYIITIHPELVLELGILI